jgi:peptidoglycan hydrolase-like protein with peptidoglycan-binding domain
MRNTLLAIFIAVGLLTAVPVTAAGLTETQIQAIVSLVTSFGVDPNVVKNVEAALRGTPTSGTTGSTACTYALALTKRLAVASTDALTGGQVSTLQRFLALDPTVYPEGLVTGYFGPATERALKKWQDTYGVITAGIPDDGYGIAGSNTRTEMQKGCAPGSQVSPTTPTQVTTPSRFATIDPFFADSLSPTLSGSASGVSSVVLSMTTSKGSAYKSGQLPVVNGKWTHTVATALAEGTYTIQLLAPDNSVLVTGSMVLYSSLVQPPSISFTANPAKIGVNATSKLSWSTTNATSCVLKYGSTVETVSANSEKTVVPSLTTTYTLTCSNDQSEATDGPSGSATATVSVVASPTCTLTSKNATTVYGAVPTYALTWTSTDADYAKVQYKYGNISLSPAMLPDVGASGTMTVNQMSPTEYTFTFYGAGGTKACSVTVGN